MAPTDPSHDRTVLHQPTGLVDNSQGTRLQPLSSTPAPVELPATDAQEGAGALSAGTRLGEFEVVRVLGEGGFSIVYLAQDLSLPRLVAIKEYMPTALAMRSRDEQVAAKSQRHRDTFDAGLKSFINEANLLAQFDHPSLVKVYRFWKANGTAYMVMPFYEGITLKEYLQQLDAPPDEQWLLSLLEPLTEVLAVIHAKQCYHRDISPDNIILLAGSQRPLLLDFGAARRVIGDMTQALTVILKSGYAPIEQYAEVPGMKQGPWTDVYALAAVVHFAVCGRTPPPAVGRIMTDHYVPLAQAGKGRYSAGFLQAIDRALQVRPEARTPSIAQLRAQLGLTSDMAEHSISQLRTASPVARATAPASPLGQRGVARAPATATPRRWILTAGAGALLLAAGAAWLVSHRGADGPAAPADALPQHPAPEAATTVTVQPPSAPLPTAQATPPPLASRPLSVSEEFERIVQARDPAFAVRATPAREQFRIGRDMLSFKVSSERDGHLYVLMFGPGDSLLLLYPNSMAQRTALRASQTVTLPSATWPMQASDPAGPVEFLVIVSQQPRDFASIGHERDGWFLKLSAAQAAAPTATDASSPGSPLAGAVRCETPGCGRYGATRFSVQVVR